MVYRYSLPKAYTLILTNFGKIGMGVILLVFILFKFSNGEISQNGIVIILIFLSCFILVIGNFLDRFANELIVDFDSQEITLKVDRTKKETVASFDEIQNIQEKGYIIFTINEEKIIYNDTNNKELLDNIENIRIKKNKGEKGG